MRNQRTKHLLGACLALLLACAVQGQNITGYRYWFNDDVSATTVVDLAPATVVEAELVLNSAALPVGHHLATIQFRDADGQWGAPWTEHFVQRGATVNMLEYWFDDEVGDAVTASVTPDTAPLINVPLNSGGLDIGFHTVTVRTIDAYGEHSVPYTVELARNGGVITGYEYWIDDAVADRVNNPIGPAGTVDLIAGLPVPTSEGAHTFTIRFRDADGGWSVPLSSTFDFFLGQDEIPGLSNYLVFPNPATSELGLRLDAAQANKLEISILDATGRTVESMGSWSVLGLAQNSWDISSLAHGSYQLRISGSDHQIQIPFVKQ